MINVGFQLNVVIFRPKPTILQQMCFLIGLLLLRHCTRVVSFFLLQLFPPIEIPFQYYKVTWWWLQEIIHEENHWWLLEGLVLFQRVCNGLWSKVHSVICSLPVPVFNFHEGPVFQIAPLEKLSGASVLSAMGLGFLLFLLIFIDQNIVVSLTNAPENRLMSFEISFS